EVSILRLIDIDQDFLPCADIKLSSTYKCDSCRIIRVPRSTRGATLDLLFKRRPMNEWARGQDVPASRAGSGGRRLGWSCVRSLFVVYACTAGCASLLSPASSASRSAMARSSSGERLAHCSGGRGLDHSTASVAVRSGRWASFLRSRYSSSKPLKMTSPTTPSQRKAEIGSRLAAALR